MTGHSKNMANKSVSRSIGVYFSANDVVYDWAVAFLNSFRSFNPELRLILIPFNDDCDRLLQLQYTYNFEVYIDPSFERLEAIGEAFELGHTPTGPYWFRRYAAFWGPCDRFMYLDVRQVVLADLSTIIKSLDAYDFDLLHFDCALNQVYEPGELRRTLLRKGKAKGFLSGAWAARQGLFSLQEFEQLATDAVKVRSQLNPRNTDQAFINYCCDISYIRYGHVADVLGDICSTSWARTSGEIYIEDEKYYLWDYGGLDHKHQFYLLHWAGYPLSTAMPNYALSRKFQRMGKSLWVDNFQQIARLLHELPNRALLLARKNRFISTLYHSRILKNANAPTSISR